MNNMMFSTRDFIIEDKRHEAAADAKRRARARNNQRKNTRILGIRKAYTRTVKGKVQQVGQSVLKASKRTAGALKAGGGRALGAGKKYGSQGVSLVKSNPKASAAAAGITVLAAGTGYFAGRKKRKRR